MDAVEYLKAWTRMCYKHNPYCKECPIGKEVHRRSSSCRTFENDNPKEAVEIVEKWAAEHPKKTRQSEFLKMFPNAKVEEGVLIFCPTGFDETLICEAFGDIDGCNNCKRKYWLTEEQNEKHR